MSSASLEEAKEIELTDGWGGSPPTLIRAGVEQEETGVLVVRQHRLFLAIDLAPPVGLLVLVVALASFQDRRMFHSPAFVAFAVMTTTWAALAFARWYATSLTLIRDAVVVRRGLFARSCCLIPLESIQELRMQQTLLGLLMDYGTLTIGISSHQEELENLSHPEVIRDKIFASRSSDA